MAEEIDLRFLGEQIKRLQGDVRQVKSDMAQADAKLEAFRETVDDRFEPDRIDQIEFQKFVPRSRIVSRVRRWSV